MDNAPLVYKRNTSDVCDGVSMSGLTNIQVEKAAQLDKNKAAAANALKGDQFIAVPDIAGELSNREVLPGGHDRVTEAGLCVWPPILLGTRDKTVKETNLSFNASDFRLRHFPAPNEACLELEPIICGKDPDEICLLYVLPPRVGSYFEARSWDRDWTERCLEGRFCKAGWKLSYATVNDMFDIDPHRKVVDWIPLCSRTELELRTLTSSQLDVISKEIFNSEYRIGTSSLHFNEDLQARLRELKDAESSLKKSVEKSLDFGQFASRLESVLHYDAISHVTLEYYLALIKAREPELRRLFAFEGSLVAKNPSEWLSSLGMPNAARDLEVPENARNVFTSRMINRGAELELKNLQLLADGFQQAANYEQKLKQLYKEHLNSTRMLVIKQQVEMTEHLRKIQIESENILEEGLLSRLELVKSLRRNDEESSVLTKLLSSGPIEIAEQIHTSALQDRELQHAREKEKLKIANEEYENKIVSLNNEVSKLSAGLKELRKAQANQECCICYNDLEGFSLSSGPGESSSSKKRFKRACLLPCMHANVCISCSEKRWTEGPQECPLCGEKLTEKPRIIYL